MTGSLLSPWRDPRRVWVAWVNVVLGLVVSFVYFVPVVTLLALAVGLLPVFPAAVIAAWLMFVVARGIGCIERSRLNDLLGLGLDDPHPHLPAGSAWGRLKARIRTRSRWREIAYIVVLLPLGAVSFVLASVAWCGSASLIALPAYVSALPGREAHFGWFTIGSLGGELLALAIGMVGAALVAPWLTLGLVDLNARAARRLLGPRADLNAEMTRLEARRAAAVDSAESERRRIERDLHDGAQQRLVSVAMDLGRARERFGADPEGARQLVEGAHEDAKAALAELRQLVRGFHPAILADRGLDAALSSAVARAPVPVQLTVDVATRPPAAVESTIYFVVLEALTNVAKHAHASRASVTIARRGDRIAVDITDDGDGGAGLAEGGGLAGLVERMTAHGGWLRVISPPGGPTTLLGELPCGS